LNQEIDVREQEEFMTTAWPTETAGGDLATAENTTGGTDTVRPWITPAERGATEPGSSIGQPVRTRWPAITFALRSFTATTLLVVGLLGAGLVGYGTGLAGYRVPSHSSGPAEASPSDEPTPPKRRACETFAGAYPSLPEPLRAAPPGRPHTLTPTSTVNLAGAASDLAELLRIDLGSEYGFKPWPGWLHTLDNYVDALQAVAFVAAQPQATEPVRAGVAELYQQALTPTLALCYVAR